MDLLPHRTLASSLWARQADVHSGGGCAAAPVRASTTCWANVCVLLLPLDVVRAANSATYDIVEEHNNRLASQIEKRRGREA